MGTISIWHTHTRCLPVHKHDDELRLLRVFLHLLLQPSHLLTSTHRPSDVASLPLLAQTQDLYTTITSLNSFAHLYPINPLTADLLMWSLKVFLKDLQHKKTESFIFLCWSCSYTLNKDVLLQSELHCVARQVLPAFRNFVQEQSAHSLIHSVSGTDHLDNNTLVFSLCILPTVKMWLKHFSFKAVSTHAVWTHRNKSKQTHQSGATKVNTRRRWWDLDWTQGTEHQEFTLISMIFSNLWHPECKACTGVC